VVSKRIWLGQVKIEVEVVVATTEVEVEDEEEVEVLEELDVEVDVEVVDDDEDELLEDVEVDVEELVELEDVVVTEVDVDVLDDVEVLDEEVLEVDVLLEDDVEVLVDEDVLVVVGIEVDVVVVAPGQTEPSDGHVPGSAEFLAAKAVSVFLVMVAAPKDEQYWSPAPLMVKKASAWEPGFGGTMVIGPRSPFMVALTMNVPPLVFLIPARLTGPKVPRTSLYLKPVSVASQAPDGIWKHCCWAPESRMISRVAPSLTGLPTTVLGLRSSLPTYLAVRIAGSSGAGFFTTTTLPATVCCAAPAGAAHHPTTPTSVNAIPASDFDMGSLHVSVPWAAPGPRLRGRSGPPRGLACPRDS
jgi:hypothetical protein